jgi:hypothetical protein
VGIWYHHYNLESFHHDWVFKEWHNPMK